MGGPKWYSRPIGGSPIRLSTRGHMPIDLFREPNTYSVGDHPQSYRYHMVYLKEIVRLHELPDTIVFDRDPKFISKFWRCVSANGCQAPDLDRISSSD